MKVTNKLGLPQYIADWLEHDDYDHNTDPNTISTTTLMKPPRALILTQRHLQKLEVDVSELIASRLGRAIHDSIERIESDKVEKERRVKRVINIHGTDYTISGKFDILEKHLEKGVLRDIKTTSVWSFIFGGKDDDYKYQLSIYRWLLSVEQEIADEAFIDFFFTDWQSSKAKTEKEYPKHRIQAGYKIKLMSLDETEAYIRERLEVLHLYNNIPDDLLPRCTPEELWAKPDTWAVQKPKNQRASKVCATREEAEIYMLNKKLNDAKIEHRPGKVKRCKYCSAAPFCNQYREMKAEDLIDLF